MGKKDVEGRQGDVKESTGEEAVWKGWLEAQHVERPVGLQQVTQDGLDGWLEEDVEGWLEEDVEQWLE